DVARRLEIAGGICKGPVAFRQWFNLLLRSHKAQDKASLRTSGAGEDYPPKQQLLDDIVAVVADYESMKTSKRAEQAQRASGIENAGKIVREAAVRQMNSDEPDGPVAPSRRRKRRKEVAYEGLIKAVTVSAEQDEDLRLRREAMQLRRQEVTVLAAQQEQANKRIQLLTKRFRNAVAYMIWIMYQQAFMHIT
ncbi:TPA: hypothetical protein N0F65_001691, partial [Lagenidium giganteum]